jgi:hypothetical protein
MSIVSIKPSKFIKQGSTLLVRFLDEDGEQYKWYKGTVTCPPCQFNEHVCCDISYEDGEIVKEACFYDDDFFADDTEEAWKFDGEVSHLIRYLAKTYKYNDPQDDSIITHACKDTHVSKQDDLIITHVSKQGEMFVKVQQYLVFCDMMCIACAFVFFGYSIYTKMCVY